MVVISTVVFILSTMPELTNEIGTADIYSYKYNRFTFTQGKNIVFIFCSGSI